MINEIIAFLGRRGEFFLHFSFHVTDLFNFSDFMAN